MLSRRTPTEFVVTVGWLGLSPFAPGTLGAIAVLPLGWWLASQSIWITIASIVAMSVIGVVLTDRYIEEQQQRGRDVLDPQEVVIDESVGCLLAMAFAPPSWPWLLAAFVLFRLFDITKPGPIRAIDQAHRGGLSVIGDDLAAGLLAGVVVALGYAAYTLV